jgi:hypothetical protein
VRCRLVPRVRQGADSRDPRRALFPALVLVAGAFVPFGGGCKETAAPSRQVEPTLRGGYRLTSAAGGSIGYRGITFHESGRYAAHFKSCPVSAPCVEIGTYALEGQRLTLRPDGLPAQTYALQPDHVRLSTNVSAKNALTGGGGSLVSGDAGPLVSDAGEGLVADGEPLITGFRLLLCGAETDEATDVDAGDTSIDGGSVPTSGDPVSTDAASAAEPTDGAVAEGDAQADGGELDPLDVCQEALLGDFESLDGAAYCDTSADCERESSGSSLLTCGPNHTCTAANKGNNDGKNVPKDAPPKRLDDVASISVIPNTHVPRSMVLGLINDDDVPFAATLACSAAHVSNRWNLTGGDAIKVVVAIADGDEELRREIAARTRAACGEAGARSLTLVDAEFGSHFMQDFGELVQMRATSSAPPSLAFLTVNHSHSGTAPQNFARALNLPLLAAPSSSGASPDYGGNIEALPNGSLLHGDGMSKPLATLLASKSAQGTTVVPTAWLKSVGHVDEYLSVLPARTACGYTIAQGDVPLALATLLSTSSAACSEMQARYVERCAEVHHYCRIVSYRHHMMQLPLFALDDVKASIRHFLRDPATAQPTTVDAFDLTIPSRPGQATIPSHDGTLGIDDFIRENLIRQRDSIDPALRTLRAALGTACGEQELFTKLPMLFRNGRISELPGAANMVSLYDTAIVPEPFLGSFRDVTRAALTGRGLKPEFVDTMHLHTRQGQVHCATQVFRDPASKVAL